MKRVTKAALEKASARAGKIVAHEDGTTFNPSGSKGDVNSTRTEQVNEVVKAAPTEPSLTLDQVNKLLEAQKRALEQSFKDIAMGVAQAMPATVVNTGREVQQWNFDVLYGQKAEVKRIVAKAEYAK